MSPETPFAREVIAMGRSGRAGDGRPLSSILPQRMSDVSADEVRSLAREQRVTGDRVAHWASLIPDDDIFLIAHPMAFNAPEHAHDYYELCFVLGGTVRNVIGRRRLYMLDNTLCVMNLDTRHALEIVDPEAVVLNIGLRPRLFEAGVFHDFMASDNFFSEYLRGDAGYGYLMFSDTDDDWLRSVVNGLVRTYASAGRRQSFALAGQLLVLLDRLSRARVHTHLGIDDRAAEIIRHIEDNYATASVSSIAREFGYSANYCSQYVRAHTGLTATELIERTRVTRAEELLAETDLSVEAIAHRVGYRGTSRFYEVFRRHHDMTPTDYRRLARDLIPLTGEGA